MEYVQHKISGEYFDSNGDIHSYEDVTVVMPKCEVESIGFMHLRSRYALRAVREKVKGSVVEICNISIDDTKDVKEKEFSFWGKDIFKMTQEELQDFATYFDLRAIPLYKKSSLKVTQERAALSYSEIVLGKEVAKDDVGVHVFKPIIVKKA